MVAELLILVSVILFLGSDGQDLPICSATSGSSCETVTPLISGPKCPNGFDLVEDYCFKISDEELSWEESNRTCQDMDAKLAEPKDLLYSDSVFASYLLENLDYYYRVYVYESHYSSKWEIFQLGGHYINNTWEWLTEGEIENSSIIKWEGCLTIGFDLLEDYHIWRGIPCSDSSEWWAINRYVCQAALGYNSYSSCYVGRTEYPSGDRVSMEPQQCQQQMCQNGTIQQYGCGNIDTGCCEYNGELYGNNDVIGAEVPTEDCSGCQQLVCQAGIIQWQDCTNCSTRCCFFNGDSYQPGRHIQSACARLVCDGANGKFNYHGLDHECPKCKAYLDPHIVTFDQRWLSYSYQGCGNYSLTQIRSSYNPTLAIYAMFVPCGGWNTLTCVDNVTFKNDKHTIITIGYEHYKIKVQVNGEEYDVSHTSPSIVKIVKKNYPVIAWKNGNCVKLQGSTGILIQFCGSEWGSNQVYVWTNLEVAGELRGLCGTADNDVNDDFTLRNGSVLSPWQRDAPVEFPLSWLALVTSNGSCGDKEARSKRQAQNTCETDPTKFDIYYDQCNESIISSFSNAEPEEIQAIIDDCVFDLCNVSDPAIWMRAVQETAQVQAAIQENTMNFTTTTTTSTKMYATTTSTTTTAPAKGCIPQTKCYSKGGYCTTSHETCDGITTDGCLGQDCLCCLTSPDKPNSLLLKISQIVNFGAP